MIAYLVTSSLTRPSPPTYPVGDLEAEPAGDRLIRNRTVTLDARDSDRWVRFDLSRGTTVRGGAESWDLAVRRFRIIMNGGEGFAGRGGALTLDGAVFDSVRRVPEDGYVATEGVSGGDPEHPILEEWYRYDLFSHLLLARGTPFALRTADGRYAVMDVLSYYCPGPEPGCLTFRYHYQGDGSRWMVPADRRAGGG